jgi:Protein kinase domain
MKPFTPALSIADATQIFNQIRDSNLAQKSGNTAFAAKTITLSGGTEATKLFERSAASKKLLGFFAPQKLKRENELAFETIVRAVQARLPGIQGDQVMVSLGIHKGQSIKLRELQNFHQTIESFKNALNAKNIHAGSSALKNRFDQYRLQATPGLVAFTQLSPEDLSLLGKYSVAGKVQDVLSFQKFVGACVDITALNTGRSTNDQQAILNFISDWCQMNENDRSLLKSSLSVNGQTAFESISILVNKMVAVDKLPVTQANSFGLDRSFARSKKFQDERRDIKSALVNNQTGVNDTVTVAAIQNGAKTLGKALGEKWRASGLQPRNYMGLESQSKAAIRSFLNMNMPLVLNEIPDSEKAAADALWLLNKEDFISSMAKAAIVELTGNKIGAITNNQITIDNNRYDIGKKIGDGGEGIVRLAETRNGEKIAVKSMLPSADPTALETEIDRHLLASNTNHENILTFHGAFRSADGTLSIAMEWAPHGDLSNIFERFGTTQRQAFIAQDPNNLQKLQNLDRYVATSLFSGLKALHQDAQMLHGDLKAENIFIGANGVPKLGDFGKSVLLEENIVKESAVDVLTQLAPEVAVNKRNYFEMTTSGDVWSLGVVIFRMLTGEKCPIKPAKLGGSADAAMLDSQEAFLKAAALHDTQARAVALGLGAISDKAMANLLVAIFHPDPNKRPTAAEALAALEAMAGPIAADDAEQRKFLIELSRWPASNANI